MFNRKCHSNIRLKSDWYQTYGSHDPRLLTFWFSEIQRTCIHQYSQYKINTELLQDEISLLCMFWTRKKITGIGQDQIPHMMAESPDHIMAPLVHDFSKDAKNSKLGI